MNLPIDEFVATCELCFENLCFVSRLATCESRGSRYMQYTRVIIELATEFSPLHYVFSYLGFSVDSLMYAFLSRGFSFSFMHSSVR